MAYEDTDDAKNLIAADKREKKDYERSQERKKANPYQGDDEDPFSGARNKAGETDPAKQEPKGDKPKGDSGASKKQSFGQAFSAARKAGKKTFSFNNKNYNTKLKKETSKAAPKAAKAAPKGYMSKMIDDDRPFREVRMGDQDFMAKRMSPSEAANAPTSADYKGKSAREMNMGLRMDPMQAVTYGIPEEEKLGPFKYGGKVKKSKKMDENMLMGRVGRNMAKAVMQKKMKSGGIASSLKAHASAPASKAHAMKSGGMAKYAKGGKVDGCARKGKTKGRMV